MDISLKRKAFRIYRKTYCDTLYPEVGSDCVVPDIQKDIKTVLSSSAVAKISEKESLTGSVHLSGEMCGEIIYLTEDEGIEVLNFALPFDCSAHSQEISPSCFCAADIKVTAFDVRVLNPRKVNVRAELEVGLCCYDEQELDMAIGLSEDHEKLFYRQASENIVFPIFVGEKQLSLDERFDLNGDVRLLSAQSRYSFKGIESVGDKLILKGEAIISAVTESESGKLQKKTFSSNFSQLFDLSEAYEPENCSVTILPSTQYFSIENGEICAELHAVTELCCYANRELMYIDDAYCCGKSLGIEYESVELTKSIEQLELRAAVKLQCETEFSPSSVLLADIRTGKLRQTGDKITAAVCAEIIYCADSNAASAKVRGELEFELPDDRSYCVEGIAISDSSLSYSDSGIELSVTATLRLGVETKCEISAVSSMSISDEGASVSTPTVCLRRMGDRNLWTIAKEHDSSVDVIRSVNKLDDAEPDPKKVLLIPSL